MAEYSMGFYCYRASFSEEMMLSALEALDGLALGFFPASMWVSEDKKVFFMQPSEYQRSLLPKTYYISPGIARIPLKCANGVSISFTESDNPRNIPANVVLKLSGGTIDENEWKLPDLLGIFRAIIENLEPDCAVLYDEAHRGRPEYDDRLFHFDMRRVPLGLFWINYYGSEWIENIGLKRLDRLRSKVPYFEIRESGGVLLAIQEEPYDENVKSHRDNQERLEKLMGLQEVQASFPNPGI
jgi:hypothetical protein